MRAWWMARTTRMKAMNHATSPNKGEMARAIRLVAKRIGSHVASRVRAKSAMKRKTIATAGCNKRKVPARCVPTRILPLLRTTPAAMTPPTQLEVSMRVVSATIKALAVIKWGAISR